MVVADDPDRRLAIVGEAQRARISTEQLTAIGFTRAMVKWRLQATRLHHLHHGVYGIGLRLPVELGDETAALLAVGAGAVLGHLSAAALWGLVPAGPREVEVVVPATMSAKSRPGICVHRSATLHDEHVTSRLGLPVTTPARVMLDLAATRGRRDTERTLDEAFARRLVTPEAIRRAIAVAPTIRGAAELLELIEPGRARGVTRSAAEERMLALLRHAGVEPPERNVAIGPSEVDFLWRPERLVVEVDGYAWHAGPAAFKRDRRKDAFLHDRGLTVIRVTWEMIDDPVPLIARIVRILAAPAAT